MDGKMGRPDKKQDNLPASSTPVLSEELLKGRRELTILHDHQEYKLRLTGNGKLILTK